MSANKEKTVSKKGGKNIATKIAAPANGSSLARRLSWLLAVISFVVYANTFHNGFTVDDPVMITFNKYVSSGASAIPTLLVTPHQKGYWDIPDDEYRPLSLVVFAAMVQVFSLNPEPLHVLNVLLFAGCVVLLFRFLARLMGDEKLHIAFLASLLFALHPLHTEVVANIKSMDEVLCFFFALFELNLFIRYCDSGKGKYLIWGGICVVLSCLSKETGVTFLAIVPLIFYFYKSENLRRSTHITFVTVSGIAFFLIVRFAILSYYHANIPTPLDTIANALANKNISTESRLATAILILGYYFRLLVLPYPLNSNYAYHTIPYAHFSDPLVLLSTAFYVAITIVGIWLLLRKKKNLYAFGILWFLITIALFANIFVMIKSTMAERFMFFPSVGFCLVAALFIVRLKGRVKPGILVLKQPLVLTAVCIVCIGYTIVVISRNGDWKDNDTLYATDLKKHPDNAHLNYLVGYNYFAIYKQVQDGEVKRQSLNEAISYMGKAARLLPEYYFALTDLGAAYFERGQPDSAEIFDKAAIKQRPNAEISRNNLSGALMQQKKYDEGISVCEETIARIKTDGNAYADLGLDFMHLGQYDSALSYLRLGMNRVPEFYGCYDVMSFIYSSLGKQDSASKYNEFANGLRNR